MGILSGYNDSYKNAEVMTSNHDKVPDGSYQVRTERAHVNLTKSGNEPRMNWQFRIFGPTQANRVLFSGRLIRHDKQMMDYLKTDLAKFGVDLGDELERLEDEDVLSSMIGQCFNVEVKTKGDFQNVYINERIDPPASTMPTDPTPPVDAYGDIPEF